MNALRFLCIGVFCLQCFVVPAKALSAEKLVNVYSDRHYRVDEEIYKNYERKTGVKVNLIKAQASELVERLIAGGERNEADLLVLVDVGMLSKAKARKLFQSIQSQTLNTLIDHRLRDQDGEWYAITKRARVIVYNPKKVKEAELSDYYALADPKWKGRILIRSSDSVYNQSLLASMHARDPKQARYWAQGIVNNMARPPKGGDRDQIKAIVRGEGDIAIVNSYYVGLLRNSPDPQEREIGHAVKIYHPNKGNGVHINISGAGILKRAPHKKHAIDLLEYLLSEDAQKLYIQNNYEYPVNTAVPITGELESWGVLSPDVLDLNILSKHYGECVKIFDEVSWS